MLDDIKMLFRAKRPEAPNTNEVSAVIGSSLQSSAAIYAQSLEHNGDDPVLAAKGGGLEIYEAVLADDQVYSNFQQRRLALLAAQLDVQPGGADKASIACADFISEMLAGMQFDRITDKMMYGVFYGYGVGECLWARDGRHWLMETVKVRKARRFQYGKDGALRLLKSGVPGGIIMEPRKFWTFESGSDNDDNPYGIGLASRCYWPTFFKRNGLRFWMLALEKYGAPTALGKYPANATQKEKDKLLQAVAAFASVSGVTIPEGMDISLLSAGASVGGNHDKLLDTMNKAISKVILSQTMTTDDGSSNSQSETHLDVREDITAADGDLLCGSFMNGPIRWLRDWNYPGARLPIVSRKTEKQEDLNSKVERDSKLYAMGYRPTKEHVQENYGDGYEPFEPPAPAGEPAEFSARPDRSATDAVDDFINSADHLAALDEELAGIAAQIETIADEAASLEDLRDHLLHLLGVPEDDAFANRLSKALFSARLHGRNIEQGREAG